MKKNTPPTTKSVHFIGIGGIGMSALARWFLSSPKARTIPSEVEGLARPSTGSGRPFKAQNWAVSGSDIASSEMTKALIKEGVRVKIGHTKANLPPSIALVIYNRAIPKDNPELAEAHRQSLCVVPYAKALGDLTRRYKTIAVTGSHGKSTTTALAALVMRSLDPTVLLGTTLKEFGGKNIRIGKGPHLILEADDFGAAFLEYSPTIAIVTNIDREHLDFYKTFSRLKKAFLKFMGRVAPGGTLILNRDDATLYGMRVQIIALVRRNKINIVWYSLRSPAARKIRKAARIFGDYNISNALAAFTLGKILKIPESKILRAISAYRGAWRRQEYKGELRIKNKELGTRNNPIIHNSKFIIHVYDDYAHHPTEIKASLRGFRDKYPHSPLICVFQPHQAERLKLLFKEFQTAFNEADATLILPLYHVAGRDRSSSLKASAKGGSASGGKSSKLKAQYDSEALVRAIQKKYPKKMIFYLAKPENLKKALATLLKAISYKLKATIVMMGAGNIAEYTTKILLK